MRELRAAGLARDIYDTAGKTTVLTEEARELALGHRISIVSAIREGKPIPPGVLADYPDLAAKVVGETPKPAAPRVTPVAAEAAPVVAPAAPVLAGERGAVALPELGPPAAPALQPVTRSLAAETGGTTTRELRPDKLGLPPQASGSTAERHVINTFHALGLDTRKIRSFDDMQAAAKDLGLDPGQLLAGVHKRPLADAEVVALRNLINDQATLHEQSVTALSRPGLADAEKEAAFRAGGLAHERIVAALKRLHVGGTETGRAVAAFRIIGQRNLDPAHWYLVAQRELAGRPFTPELRTIIDEMIGTQDRVGLARLIGSLHKSTTTDKAIALWKAGMLSNPATDVANVSGNVFMAVMEGTKDIPAVPLDAMLSIASGQRTKVLSPIIVAEKFGAIMSGPPKALEYLRKGDLADDLLTKYDFNRGTRFDTPVLQFYTQAVFRRLGAEDLLFREPALRGSVAEQAIVAARNQGLKGQSALEFIRDSIKRPTERMVEIAKADADYSTFQQQSNLTEFLGKARGPARVAVEAIAPFRKTPINIAKAILDYSPFGMPKAVINFIRMRAGDRYLQQKYFVEGVGRSVTGTTLAGLGWAMARKGLAVGLPPKDQNDRENRRAQGIPYGNAILSNGQWFTLDRIAPGSNILLLGVNAAEQFDKNPTLTGKLAGTAFAGFKTLREQTFLRGVAGLGKAIDNPEQFGGNFIEQLAGSVVPSLVGAVARGTDPTQRKSEGIGQVLASRLPGARGALPPVIDARGRVVPAPKGLLASLFSPVTATPQDTSLVARALASSGYGPSLGKRADLRKLAPSDTAQTRLEREYGQAMEQAMQQEATRPGFFQMDREDQEDALERAVNKARARVRKRWQANSHNGGSR
jgi:hypothetical protein